jgi:hypothetical protein
VNSYIESVEENQKVITARQNLEKFLQKNKVMHESVSFSIEGGCTDEGFKHFVNAQSALNNNIDVAIQKHKEGKK